MRASVNYYSSRQKDKIEIITLRDERRLKSHVAGEIYFSTTKRGSLGLRRFHGGLQVDMKNNDNKKREKIYQNIIN